MNRNSLVERKPWDTSVLREDFLFPFEQQFNSLFDKFFNNSVGDSVKASAGYPKMDIVSDEKTFSIHAALPGLEAEDVAVEMMSDNVLKISGKKSEIYNTENAQCLTKELRTSQFSRHIKLPEWVDEEPKAAMKNGILSLTWNKPEAERKFKTKLIEIKKE
ncbi:MAG: Hsp20/alpha crystallin family protein [Crenarchaeota archaeon]|nr:MAG: Hsp20/alpha crystallin family protein [Thermoproteota archaeon]